MSPRIFVLGGPNLGSLGEREPEIYGATSWTELGERCRAWSAAAGCECEFLQTDAEGELVGLIGRAGREGDGIVLNAAAYTHTSVAVRDAVTAVAVPVVELHLTLPAAREPLRRRNLLADVVQAVVAGFGADGYRLAIEGLSRLLEGERA